MNKTKSFHIDLHTHSILSYDGGIRESEYEKILDSGILDCVAITDHKDISFAESLKKKLGDKVIVGQEVKTREGEIIGLFLREKIADGLPALETAEAIRQQEGLVYIPHPFEAKRSSLQKKTMKELTGRIDIIEVFNARGFGRGKPYEAEQFARAHNLALAASSDSHTAAGLGSAFSIVSQLPRRVTLVSLLLEGSLHKTYAPFYTYFSPLVNKVRKRLSL